MDIFNLLAMIGGLALFLYGMNLMGDGLAKLSGGKLESILSRLTSNKLSAVLLGAGVTAVIQSSSATTVMVVGFVNSGIMKLHQAVGIIMGANVGTTFTSWILSLSGIESESFFVQLLKPTSFSPILALIGIIFLLFSKTDKKKDIGSILIGFAILMFGMDGMSSAVEPLKDVPEFTNLLTMFSQPILGMLVGAILTAVIQSSSASVGILQALCMTGMVNYGTVIPIIMGQNIGTCVTAIISSIGASKNAKRTAFVHLYFNLIGTILFMVVFYTVNLLIPFAFLKDAAGPAGIAVIHSLFNIGATVVLFPFSGVLERLACLSIPEDKEETVETMEDIVLQHLDVRFLDKPAFALMQATKATEHMAELAKDSLHLATSQIFNYDIEICDRVISLEKEVDHYEDQISRYMVQIASRHLSAQDGKKLIELQHCVGDFERISDISMNLVHAVMKMHQKEQEFSQKAIHELVVLAEAVNDMMHYSVECFVADDKLLAESIEPLEECIDELNKEITKRHRKRLRKGKCSVDMGFVLADITTDLERIGDHCSSVALNVIQSQTEDVDAHEYVEQLKSGDNVEYDARLLNYREKYQLP
ncbi:MAG: Na/Pi cotransporter family protein [Lachnospiraceae bacterium]